ncbi:MAG: metallophosphoesterase [Melioribacteraceae bacterium]|nr:metallophosphoesterase [Melioribacteraceae bacterium]
MKLVKLVVISIVILFNISNAQETKKSDEVRFVLFGDSQFGNPPEFERMIHEAEMLRPDFAIQVGDLIHGYTKNKEQLRNEWKRFKNQISPLTTPFYPVPGNHDVVTDEAEEIYAEVWGKEKLYYSFDKEHVHIIVLNSWWQEADDRIEEWQRDWLVEDLKSYADKNGGIDSDQFKTKSIFVFVHSPLWKYPDEVEGKKDWDLVHEILKKYPVKLVAAGHSHEYVWENKDSINYLVINSAGVSRPSYRGGKFSSFLHVSALDNGDIHYGNIKAGSVLPLDSVNPDERKTVPQYNIREQTIQVPDWKEGKSLSMKVNAPIINSLSVPRRYRLDWYIPYEAKVTIEPESMWLDIPANDTANLEFIINSENAPSPDNLPWMEISSKENLRTGYVARKIEKKYREEKNSSVILDAPVEFKGKYRLFIPPVSVVKRIDGEIKLDGVIDDAVWERADIIGEFKKSGNEPIGEKTQVRILYDDDYLYFGVWLEEPNPKDLRNEAIGPIPLTWDDDDFEMFFDPAQSQSDYNRLFINSAGTRFNSLPRWHQDKYFESSYKSKIHVGENFWSIEMIIPWSDIALEKAPKAGDKWGFNVGRHRQQSYIKRSKWSGNLYNPKTYGILRFE